MSDIRKIRHNVINVDSISAFAHIKGGGNNHYRDVCFVRAIGSNFTYINDIKALDEAMLREMNEGKGQYYRLSGLKRLQDEQDIQFYSACYTKWVESGKQEMNIRLMPQNTKLAKTLGSACVAIEKLYSQGSVQATESILKNLIVKMLFWMDSVFGNKKFVWEEAESIKIVADNVQKRQEYLFFYLLTLVGCDVLLLQSARDIGEEEEKLNLSTKFVLGAYSEVVIPGYNSVLLKEQKKQSNTVANVDTNTVKPENKIRIQIPKRERSNNRQEKSFEELARLASSVVLIVVHDEQGKPIGGGSGIMIGKDGYILTNCHVACRGKSYSIRIEEDENVYETDELIKYNQMLDLAVLRINRKLTPLPIYDGEKELVRGQKVVAIGSPLGLFNSVSDGIISGFRKFDDVDMIQFTAPISDGSSGGAVLNMQGEVIGISTAGFDDGQNINLAMGYECINLFIKGFV